MIVSFAGRVTEALYHGEPRKLFARLPADIREVALLKLDVLNAARDVSDLRSPPGNRLEALKGTLRGLHSIRINDQWRVIFRWEAGDAHDVRIADYH